MAKIPSIRIPSDDFVMDLRGVTYRPHEGEWVELIPVTTAGDARAITIISQLQSDIEAAQGDANAIAEISRIGTEQLFVLASSLASRVTAWSWTDLRGEPLPQPDGDPETFMALTTAELNYLLGLNAESPLGKLNGSHDSPNTSSATKSSRSGRTASRANAPTPMHSSTAPSRTKAS